MQIQRAVKRRLLAVLALLVIGLGWMNYYQLRPVYLMCSGLKYPPSCPEYTLVESINPVKDTKHLIVSAYEDHREKRLTRVIGIVHRNSTEPLSCHYCCENGSTFQTKVKIDIHRDHFGFPFATANLLCEENPECNASHVTIEREERKTGGRLFLPIRNREKTEGDFPYEFTVCISNLFGNYNNALQFIQTMEVYKILGIQKVTIYNTSCGPQLDKVLHYYAEEGLLEVVPWPITQFLNPSRGWIFARDKGDLHYYGQLTTLNDCIYRNMYKSKYLLLNDMDEIIMPYKHGRLHELMGNLSAQNPKVGVFVVENHIFPKTMFDDNKTFDLPLWREVPGINILEHICIVSIQDWCPVQSVPCLLRLLAGIGSSSPMTLLGSGCGGGAPWRRKSSLSSPVRADRRRAVTGRVSSWDSRSKLAAVCVSHTNPSLSSPRGAKCVLDSA